MIMYAYEAAEVYCVTTTAASEKSAGGSSTGSSGSDEPIAMCVVRSFNEDKKISDSLARPITLSTYLFTLYAFMIPLRITVKSYKSVVAHGEYGGLVHKAFAKLTGEHKRIDYVCTEPSWQGCGIQTVIFQRLCSDADADGTVLYLSSSDEGNQRYYERFGFALVGEAGEGGFVTRGMARLPKNRREKGEVVVQVGDVSGRTEERKRGRGGAALVVAVAAAAVVVASVGLLVKHNKYR
jgi:hypothetical protein